MCNSPILVVLSLTAVSAVKANSLFGPGKCITIEKGNQILYERQERHTFSGYLHLTNKGAAHDDQKWILEKPNSRYEYYRLKNKKSKKIVEVHRYPPTEIDYLKTTAPNSPYSKNEFKFKSTKTNGEYYIYTNYSRPTKADSGGWIWLPASETLAWPDSFKIQSCT
jgi:hypothetical protein